MPDQNSRIIPGSSKGIANIKASVRQFFKLQQTFINNRFFMIRFMKRKNLCIAGWCSRLNETFFIGKIGICSFRDNAAGDGFKRIVPLNHIVILDMCFEKGQVARMKFPLIFDRQTILQNRNESFQYAFVFENRFFRNECICLQRTSVCHDDQIIGFLQQQRIRKTTAAQL